MSMQDAYVGKRVSFLGLSTLTQLERKAKPLLTTARSRLKLRSKAAEERDDDASSVVWIHSPKPEQLKNKVQI